jgi:hypothetical protein
MFSYSTENTPLFTKRFAERQMWLPKLVNYMHKKVMSQSKSGEIWVFEEVLKDDCSK